MPHHPLCPQLEKAMRLLGKPWSMLILDRLSFGPRRFGEIEAELLVSARILSERLKELEREGLVVRAVHPETPVRIEYSLSPQGAALEPALREIERWASRWLAPTPSKPGPQ